MDNDTTMINKVTNMFRVFDELVPGVLSGTIVSWIISSWTEFFINSPVGLTVICGKDLWIEIVPIIKGPSLLVIASWYTYLSSLLIISVSR